MFLFLVFERKMKNIFLALITIFLFIIIFKWIHYLASNNYIKFCSIEGFSVYDFLKGSGLGSTQNKPFFPTFPNIIERMVDRGTPDTSHTVNLPLTTDVSCKNACINSRCSYTGQQCLADIDCPGCNSTKAPYYKNPSKYIDAYNDSGKSGAFSSLTSDIGSRAAIFDKSNIDNPSPQANFGKNTWKFSLDEGQKMFNKRYANEANKEAKGMNTYYNNEMPTTTGLFFNDGPLAANY